MPGGYVQYNVNLTLKKGRNIVKHWIRFHFYNSVAGMPVLQCPQLPHAAPVLQVGNQPKCYRKHPHQEFITDYESSPIAA